MAVLNLIMMIFGYVTTIATIGFIFWLNIVDWREKRKTDKMMKDMAKRDMEEKIYDLERRVDILENKLAENKFVYVDYMNEEEEK